MSTVAQYVQQFEADISKLKDASKYIVDIYRSERFARGSKKQYVYSEKTIAATAVAIKHIDKIKTKGARKLVARFATGDVKYRLRSVKDDLFDEAIAATRNVDVLFLFAVCRWDYKKSYGKVLNKYYPQVTDQQHSNFFWAVFSGTRWGLIFERLFSLRGVPRFIRVLSVEDNLFYRMYVTDFSKVSIKSIFSYFSVNKGCSNSVAAHLVVLWLATNPGKNLSQTDLDWLRAYIDDPVIFGDPSYSVSDLTNSINTRNIPLLASAGIFDEDVIIRYYGRFSDDGNVWRAIFDDQDSSVLRLIGSAMVHILNDEPLTPEEKGALWFYRYSDLYPDNVRKRNVENWLENLPIHLLSVAGGADVLRKVMDSFTAPIEIPNGLYSNVRDKKHLSTRVAMVNEAGSTKMVHTINVYESLYKVVAAG